MCAVNPLTDIGKRRRKSKQTKNKEGKRLGSKGQQGREGTRMKGVIILLPDGGLGPGQVSLGPPSSVCVCVFDLCREISHESRWLLRICLVKLGQ